MANPARDRAGPDYATLVEPHRVVWLPDGHLAELLDPSADRWRNT